MSLRAGENPDAKTLRVIEERFCKELGYAEHQRISVIHHDTDNVHIHVAINKIHPKTLTLHDPVRDYKKRSTRTTVRIAKRPIHESFSFSIQFCTEESVRSWH
jgi:Relaxase/Mobilisation nuclease domain